jgi:hypothetical protein
LRELAQAVIAVHLLAPDTARARPATQLSSVAGFQKVFSDELPESLFDKSLRLMETVETYLRTPTAQTFPDTATNARFYLASGYVIRSMGLKSLSGYSAAKRIDQLKPEATNVALEEVHKILTAAVSTLDDGKTPRDRIFKGAALKEELFGRILRINKEQTKV